MAMMFDPQIKDPATTLDKVKSGGYALLAVIGVLLVVVSWFLA